MKAAVFGKNAKSVNAMKKVLTNLNFTISNEPDFMVSLGGDGTFLMAEKKFPGVPKLLIKDSEVCKKCEGMEFDKLFLKMRLKEFTIMNFHKLEATYMGKKYLAVNDIVIRNKLPIYAIRFDVDIDGKKEHLIGDGIVASTVFGSTGYHYSITKTRFDKGIGLAYNNLTTDKRNQVLPEKSVVKITLKRHDAHLAIDNLKIVITMKERTTVTIRQSKQVAQVIKIM